MAIDDRRRSESSTLRVSTWHGDQRVAVLSTGPEGRPPSRAMVAAELAGLRRLGVERVLTGALHAHELGPFIDNGFTDVDRLHLLRHDLIDLPPLDPEVRMRRARLTDRSTVLAIDRDVFDQFWVLDRQGLDEAIHATPSSRFRVIQERGEAIVGYAVTGRAGDRGYLQRLGVAADHHGRGLGRALVADSLHWLQRAHASRVLVNTQVTNHAAYSLYLSCGFVPEPTGLTVLGRPLDGFGT